MGEFASAAVCFPAVLFTAALGVTICFWLLVACRVAGYDSFDGDLDAKAFGVEGVPVSVSGSLVAVLGWAVCVSGELALWNASLPRLAELALKVALLPLSLLAAWLLTRLLVRLLVRLLSRLAPSRRPVRGGSAPT